VLYKNYHLFKKLCVLNKW